MVFNKKYGDQDKPITLSCGHCIGCRIEKSRQWAIRCSHEASLYEQNVFVTLTYEDSQLPPFGSLNLSHFQNFMKRLRITYPHKKIRFFHCGEYGEETFRPHYHACLFNIDFPDQLHYKTINQIKTYISPKLERLWSHGQCTTGDVTFQSAAYVARYIIKKITGELADDYYQGVDPETGEIQPIQPEYATMSRRPGLGADWLKKYKTDAFPSDFVVIKGKKHPIPSFYSMKMKAENEMAFLPIRGKRAIRGRQQAWNNTPERLKVRKTVLEARLKNLKRELE